MMVYGGIGAQNSGTRTEKDLNNRSQYILNERDNKHMFSSNRDESTNSKTRSKTKTKSSTI